MKRILSRWITFATIMNLRQIHLHIDDPRLVIRHKRSERFRRDAQGTSFNPTMEEDGARNIDLPEMNDELVLPRTFLLRNREHKYELAQCICFVGPLQHLSC